MTFFPKIMCRDRNISIGGHTFIGFLVTIFFENLPIGFCCTWKSDANVIYLSFKRQKKLKMLSRTVVVYLHIDSSKGMKAKGDKTHQTTSKMFSKNLSIKLKLKT